MEDKIKNINQNPQPLRFKSKSGIMEIFPNQYIKYSLLQNVTSPELEELKRELVFLEENLQGKKLPFLVDNRNLKKLDSKVINFMEQNSPKFTGRVAIIVSPGISKFIFHVLLFLKKPPFPMKLFTN